MSMSNSVGIRRAVAVMDRLSCSPEGCSFSELRRALDPITPAGVSRVLKVLIDEGWVEKSSTGLYRPAQNAFTLARRLAETKSKADILQPIVQRLAETTNESAIATSLSGNSICFIAKHEMAGSFHYRPVGGKSLPFFNSFARASVAFLGEPERSRIYETLPKEPTSGSNVVLPTLDEVREQGYVMEVQRCLRIAAPILRDGHVYGSIGISSPQPDEGNRDATIKAGLAAANEAGEELVRWGF